jgi:nucleoside-diphosphate-sugar epimerase
MIVVTGATGRTGRRVTGLLLAKGEKVRVVGRNATNLARLVQLGAEPLRRERRRCRFNDECYPRPHENADLGSGGSFRD